ERVREGAEVAGDSVEPPLLLRRLEERARVHALGDRHALVRGLEGGEVELGDRLVDEATLVLRVQDLAGDARRRFEGQVGDLGADLVEGALRLRLDLAARLLEPSLSA